VTRSNSTALNWKQGSSLHVTVAKPIRIRVSLAINGCVESHSDDIYIPGQSHEKTFIEWMVARTTHPDHRIAAR